MSTCAYSKQLKAFDALQAIRLSSLLLCQYGFEWKLSSKQIEVSITHAMNYNNNHSFGLTFNESVCGLAKSYSLCSSRLQRANDKSRQIFWSIISAHLIIMYHKAISRRMNMIFLWCHISFMNGSVKHHFLSCHHSICEQCARTIIWTLFAQNALFHWRNFLAFCVFYCIEPILLTAE